MDMLMEKLRSKSSQYKSFTEYSKAIRMSQLEKRFAMDVADRSQLQKCLDTLLQSMSVNSLQGMVERLESISRQLSLKLMGQTGLELFISSDMFYVEVALEPSGSVKDVKVHHEGKSEQQSCETLVRALSKGDFEDFTAQLEGLISIYQLNAEKKVKCKAFSALCALETDLEAMWAASAVTKDIQELLQVSPVGILEKRRGGHTMKLTYFISPYDALAAKQDLDLEYLSQNSIGNSVTVCLEGSGSHKLQTVPIITVPKNGGKGLPVAAPLTANNSSTLPAYFSLKLNKPMPISVDLLKQIAVITELDCADVSAALPIFSLITKHASNDKLDSANNRPLFVNLPDQVHCYFMTESKNLTGVIVQSIPFTHPNHVPQVLALLKQQAVFNCLVASAVRITDKQDIEKMTMLEVSALSWRQLSITFEHPLEENIATLEMDLTNLNCPAVRLYSTLNTDTKHMSRVLQRCLSIPVTMRALIKSLEQHGDSAPAAINGTFPSAPNGGLGGPQEPSHDFTGPSLPTKPKTENGASNGRSSTFDDFSAFSASVLDAAPKVNEVKKRKHSTKAVADDFEIVQESSSETERDEQRRAKKAKVAHDPKALTTPSVTITPITSGSSINTVLSGMGLERRPGIEIIPLNTAPPANLPSSITITPIPNDKDMKKSRPLDDREKKKKRKREDDTKMGPPEKVPMKSDPLSKPVSVSIKPTIESASSPRPASPLMRKYTSSPTQQIREKQSGKSSPVPRHSPVYSSPKNSPKHGSPKPSSGSSGKPSMSSMKSQSGSPTSKNSEVRKSTSSSSSSKDQRDRDRKNASSPKIKSSSVKLKPLDFVPAEISLTNISPPPLDPKCANNPLQRNRKGSLSAVIDKLKSAQEVVDPGVKEKIPAPPSSTTITKVDAKPLLPGGKLPEGVKNPAEYMVKPSSDGMKITINKTRTKDGSKGASSKTHTGLKPGVVSGPASKKPSVPGKTGPPKITSSTGSKLGMAKPSPKPLMKTGVSSPKLPTDLSKKDPNKSKPVKSDKSVFKDGQQRKGSPVSREEDVLKALKLDSGLPGSLVKPFDTKFQIPKLSARSNPTPPITDLAITEVIDTPNNNNVLKNDKVLEKADVKVIEVGSSKTSLDLAAGLKYQSKVDSSDRMAKTANSTVPNRLSLPLALTNISPKLPMTSPNLPTTSLSSITSKLDKSEEVDTVLPPTEVRPLLMEAEAPAEVAKAEEPTKVVENCSATVEPSEILLDFSTSQSLQAKLAIVDKTADKMVVAGGTQLPPSGEIAPVSHSPVPVIDDDLMDEAIMMRK